MPGAAQAGDPVDPVSSSATGAPATVGPADPIRDLAPLVVSGVQPGPALWKVSRGGHVMWVLGLVAPLPREMEWRSTEVEQVIAQADAVLQAPVWAVNSDVGVFKGLSLLPAALRARRNPDRAELADVLPATLHARWEVQKDRYLGWEPGIERWRPMFAAEKLERKAMERLGLDGEVVAPVIAAAAKRSGVEQVRVVLETKVEAPRELLKRFNGADLDDVACLERTVDRLENELPMLVARANAWAVGDLAELRRLPQGNPLSSCLTTVLQSELGRSLGYADMEARMRDTWLQAAQKALAEHAVSLAMLPMRQVLGGDGYLAALERRGFTVLAPDASDEVGLSEDTSPRDEAGTGSQVSRDSSPE
ncbi:TraB/GumN family protein [Lysobacter sp. A3-1-A15]